MAGSHRATGVSRPRRSAIRILLVDDDAMDRERVAAIVRSDVAPAVIEEIRDHVGFFAALRSPDFDLVITEQDLHWSSGREVLTAIKSLRPSIPVIMVARSEDEKMAAEALKEGLDAYIPKSGELAIRLRSSVRSALQRLEFEQRVDSLETRLQDLLDRLNVGVFRASFDGKILEANAAFLRLIGGAPLKAARQLPLGELFADVAVYRGLLARLSADGQVRDFQAELRTVTSSRVWMSLTGSLQAVGGERLIDGLVEDVSLARQAEQALRAANQDYRTVFEITSAATAILDDKGTIAMVNSAFERLWGAPRKEIEGKGSWESFVVAADVDRVGEQMRALALDPTAPPRSVRFDFISRQRRPLNVTATLAMLPVARRTVISLLNLTERQKVEEQLLHNAFHDGLTGLPNRLSLIDRIETLLAPTKGDRLARFALVLLGLDRFRVINDSLGHRVGDLLLQAVSRRLEGVVGDADTVARCSGDVFAVVVREAAEVEAAAGVAASITAAFAEPFSCGDHQLHCTASSGVVLGGDDRDAEQLYIDAETAMYEAKRSGGGRWLVFDPTMSRQVHDSFALGGLLRRALAGGTLEVHYQPIVALMDGAVIGFEAMPCGRGADGKPVGAEQLRRAAEDSGLHVPVRREVVHAACRRLKQWLGGGGMRPRLFASVSLSRSDLVRRELPIELGSVLAETGVAPTNLMLEVAEGLLTEDAAAMSSLLEQLHGLGIELCLGGFGGEACALAHLHHLPFRTVKLNAALLAGIGDDARRWRLVDGVHALALHLGMRVIVDGIELEAQRRRLLDLGCNLGQGRLLSPPVDGEAAGTVLLGGVALR